jgi:hypothetical protein
MDAKRKYRLRVDSCIGTIIDVHKTISEEYEDQDFIERFEELKQSIEDLDMSSVSERDVMMVEQATNALLGEFRVVFEAGNLGLVYAQQTS